MIAAAPTRTHRTAAEQERLYAALAFTVCPCAEGSPCGRVIEPSMALCVPCANGQHHLHFGQVDLALPVARLNFLRGIALEVRQRGGVAAWQALLAAALGDWPEELQG
jgi:hypothetical protein